jgi:4a-hydroxytetrahydrobiopterin dehydratase
MAIDRTLLDDAEVDRRLVALPGWRREGRELCRDLRFANFSEAFAFMTRVAFVAEKLDHHPEWSNVYDRVRLRITTHDRGGITAVDFAFAGAIDDIAPPEG